MTSIHYTITPGTVVSWPTEYTTLAQYYATKVASWRLPAKRQWAGPWRLVEVTYQIRGHKPVSKPTWVRPYLGSDGKSRLQVGPIPLPMAFTQGRGRS